MKPLTAILLLLTLGAGLQAGYSIGHRAGIYATWKIARSWAAYEAARRTHEQVRLFRIVQQQREASEYRRGRETCF